MQMTSLMATISGYLQIIFNHLHKFLLIGNLVPSSLCQAFGCDTTASGSKFIMCMTLCGFCGIAGRVRLYCKVR